MRTLSNQASLEIAVVGDVFVVEAAVVVAVVVAGTSTGD